MIGCKVWLKALVGCFILVTRFIGHMASPVKGNLIGMESVRHAIHVDNLWGPYGRTGEGYGFAYALANGKGYAYSYTAYGR